MRIEKYSVGVGDRFGREGVAQLAALQRAAEAGASVVPVWNKSNREHQIIGTAPADTRRAADAAVEEAGWRAPYYVDADHIGRGTVDRFLDASDFFTLDVAECIGTAAGLDAVEAFVEARAPLLGRLAVPGVEAPLEVTPALVRRVGAQYLAAVGEAARTYRHIAGAKGAGTFVTEVSMDECDTAQSPAELLLILAALADERVPVQTIAPRFPGRFNKGVDYVGDPVAFEREFRADLAVLRTAVERFGLPEDLKLSVHSGSDKFSIYGPIRRALRAFDAGVHVKTAGTTWLEEIIGLAEAGGDGLAIAQEVYREAYGRREELCAPYAAVIDIDPSRLPDPSEVARWPGRRLAAALRHEPDQPVFNADMRQLVHVGYKVAAELGPRYLAALERHREVVAAHVTENLYERHLRLLFVAAP